MARVAVPRDIYKDLSGKLRVFVYTVHGVIDEYHASNNKNCNAFGF